MVIKRLLRSSSVKGGLMAFLISLFLFTLTSITSIFSQGIAYFFGKILIMPGVPIAFISIILIYLVSQTTSISSAVIGHSFLLSSFVSYFIIGMAVSKIFSSNKDLKKEDVAIQQAKLRIP